MTDVKQLEDRHAVKVGMPCRLKFMGRKLLGRIVGFDGGELEFATPHGSLFQAGLVWYEFDLSVEDYISLTRFETEAINAGTTLYAGRLGHGNETGLLQGRRTSGNPGNVPG